MLNPGDWYLINNGMVPALTPESMTVWLVKNSGEIIAETQLVEDRMTLKEEKMRPVFEALIAAEIAAKRPDPNRTQAEFDELQERIVELRKKLDDEPPPYNNAAQEVAFKLTFTYKEVKKWIES